MSSQTQRDYLVQPDAPVSERRRLVQVMLGTGILASAATFFYPVLKYLFPPSTADLGAETVVAGKVGELKPNSAAIFRFGSKPALLIRETSGAYRALSATCTHLSCTVQYRQETRQIWCACHNGVYDLNGHNVSGPPPRPLEVYEVHVRGEEIVVNRKRES